MNSIEHVVVMRDDWDRLCRIASDAEYEATGETPCTEAIAARVVPALDDRERALATLMRRVIGCERVLYRLTRDRPRTQAEEARHVRDQYRAKGHHSDAIAAALELLADELDEL